jgi:hypothetical protein
MSLTHGSTRLLGNGRELRARLDRHGCDVSVCLGPMPCRSASKEVVMTRSILQSFG